MLIMWSDELTDQITEPLLIKEHFLLTKWIEPTGFGMSVDERPPRSQGFKILHWSSTL